MKGRHEHGHRVGRYLWLLVAVGLMLVFSITGELLVSLFENVWLKNTALAANGIVGVAVVLGAMRWISVRLNLSRPSMAQWRRPLFVGLTVGLGVSVACGLLFYSGYRQEAALPFGEAFRASSFVGNVSPALVEEASMRAGVVHLLAGLHGPWAGLAGGSLPFGLLHIFGRLFGNPVGVQHVIGTTLAGLLLSILYLRFGFWAAVGCHWVWNSLAGTWVRFAGVPKKGGVQMFEGAWETVAVLAVVCLVLFAFGDRRWMQRTARE